MFFKVFELPKEPSIPQRTVSILDFGASINNPITKPIKSAIEHLSLEGGGKVVVPKGRWSCGAIELKSNIELHFEEGALVNFSYNPEDYPVVLTMYEGIRCYNYSPLIYGNGLENVAITGNGVLDGAGPEWWKWAKNLKGRDILYRDTRPVEERIYGTVELALRPMFLQVLKTKNLYIEGLTFKNSPCWTVHPVFCENVIVRNVKINNPTVSPNTDGVNIESCNRALVEDCTVIATGDDMYCLKAGRNEDAWEVGIPCENVIIRRCRSFQPSMSGGIVIGSEMSADVRNILAEDCDFAHNANCLRIKAKDGRGGIVENVEYKNLHMSKGMKGINLSFRYSCEANDDPEVPGLNMPKIRNIYCENIVCDSVQSGITIDNVPGGVMENLYFKNIKMTAGVCVTSDNVSNLNFEKVSITEDASAGQVPADATGISVYDWQLKKIIKK